MSIYSLDAIPINPVSQPTRQSRCRDWATCLARYTAKRRQELCLTVAQAAELSGLQLSEWYGLEEGWVPEHLGTLRAIAGTLQVRWQDYHMLAFFAMLGQTCC